ncbi:Gfo/Idh/MocA family oxidoreductase [Actinoplanes sp. LDG1-06]|uniref:Gfo/Idh/MocA family oxidoreductase n=1 Tax=Paractinoplanes ovalisporus TaxID=2810368 RepID=A0ABS2A5E8_9ACTN|nr:Gfo/Idh/MocA family oxidoreductase [Actinoplanes ovalisporus]MBM2615070.1 Gfo/Idh/MocA family oxidoreductase [Actinoplanes ovalisporus]
MPTTGKPLRIGLIGAGAVGIRHVQAARDNPEVSLRAVCDLDPRTASAAARQVGADIYTDYRDMLAGADLDAVIITSPHSLHADMTVAAAATGAHVLVEKPMATSLEDCDRMIDACARAGVVLAVGHVSRFDPSIAEAGRILGAGTLGPVRGITHRRSAHYQPGSRPGWFFDPVLAGGGIVINVGTHGLDRIQMLGGGMATRVTAQTLHRDGLEIETDCFGLLELDSGVKAGFVFTSAALSYVDETLILCQDGSLRWSATDGLWMSRTGRPEERTGRPEERTGRPEERTGRPEERVGAPSSSPREAFAAQLADFVTACRTGGRPFIDGPYGRAVLATVLAVYESSATGEPALVRSAQVQRLA